MAVEKLISAAQKLGASASEARAAVGVLLGLGTTMQSQDAEAALSPAALKKALKAGIDNFSPAEGAPKMSGPLDRGAGVKSTDNVFAILSAENPNAQSIPDWKNKLRTLKLANELIAKYGEDAVSMVKGKYGNVERSLMVEGMPTVDALRLGQRYGQESVFTDRGLLYTDKNIGKGHPIAARTLPQGGEDWTADIVPNAKDFYTEVKTSGRPEWGIPSQNIKFQYPIAWDETIDVPLPDQLTPSSTVGYHYGTTPNLLQLDPNFTGTGAAGAEMSRIQSGAPNRVNFYQPTSINSPVIPKPEDVVASRGKNLYRGDLTNVYDLETDPQGWRQFSKNPTELEQNLKEAGYSGYSTSALADPKKGAGGSVVMFNKTPVKAATGVGATIAAGSALADQPTEAVPGFSFDETRRFGQLMKELEYNQQVSQGIEKAARDLVNRQRGIMRPEDVAAYQDYAGYNKFLDAGRQSLHQATGVPMGVLEFLTPTMQSNQEFFKQRALTGKNPQEGILDTVARVGEKLDPMNLGLLALYEATK